MWSILLFNLIFYNCASNFIQGSINNIDDVDVAKTIVWGPGLNPENITLKARYFFIQLVTKDGENLTESVGPNVISSKIIGKAEDNAPCHIWYQLLDCEDGSYIVRYRIYNVCFNLQIIVKIQNKILYLKQSKFKGPVYEEECYCPNPSIHSWLESNDCVQNYTQILSDLELFPNVDFDSLRNKIIARYNQPNRISICHYVIKSNKIYRQCYGQHVGFKIFSDEILLSITRKTTLPDVEFFMNLGDWPLVPKDKLIYPIFSWCGSEDTRDIVLPTYDITESSIKAMDSVMLDMLSVQGNTKLRWNEKINKVFWRGRDSRRERLDLIDIARSNPHLFNASITNFFFFTDEIKKYGPEQKHVSFFDFFKYKYQLNVDGTVAAYRFPYLLAGNSLVFKQKSKYYEFFYKSLTEDIHFVSIKNDLSDLVEKINWAIKNDDKAYNISREAREYTRNNLMPQHIFCYYITLIKEWSKRLTNSIQVFPEMEYIPQRKNNCKCIGKKIKRDEL